ncbi:hypothetical protein ASC87_21210 [Rhizobacter sp. Root1221]|nr:hypothetical protein ASC87_21210 [Rhizobacter sp. Root1221]
MLRRLDQAAFLNGWKTLAEHAIVEHLLDDGAAVIAGIRALKPEMHDLTLLEGRLAAKRGDYREAIQLLGDLESSPTHWSLAKAWIASCQYLAGDADWEIKVNEVLLRDDACAKGRRFAQCLRDAELPGTGLDQFESEATATSTISPSHTADLGYGFFMRA